MGKNSKIEWTDHTWNPWVGCNKVSLGCANCYMFRDQTRWGNDPTEVRRTSDRTFNMPNRLKKPSRIFVCSWSDFFHEGIGKHTRKEAMDIIFGNSEHDFLILTKRPANIHIPNTWWEVCTNAWLGVSVENNWHRWRIKEIEEIPAAIKFVSAEPLLEPLFLESLIDSIDWVIVGGESGPHARNFEADWAREIRDLCKEHDTAFFMKQMTGNTKAERENIPDDLMIREFPK